MWHDRIFICFMYAILFYPSSYVLSSLYLILEFLKCRSCHDSNEECIIFSYIQYSQPHITLYFDEFLKWDGNNKRNVESLIMILFSASISSLIPLYTGILTKLLLFYQTETLSNSFGKKYGSV